VFVHQVRVVDGEHQRLSALELVQHPANGLCGVTGRDVEQADEGTQRQRTGGGAAVGPAGGETPAGHRGQPLAREPGLAHSGRSGEEDAGRTWSDRRRDLAQLLVPPGQRPRPLHGSG
jgi:hypothetical protein